MRLRVTAALLLPAFLAASCGNDSALTPMVLGTELQTQSLGAAVYEVICSQVAAAHDATDVSGAASRDLCLGIGEPNETAPAQLVALHGHRARLITAVDGAIDDEFKDKVRQWLSRLMPLHDDGTLRAHSAFAAGALRRLAADSTVLQNLTQMGPFNADQASLVRAVLSGPQIGELLQACAEAVHARPQAWRDLQAALLRLAQGDGASAPVSQGADGAALTQDPQQTRIKAAAQLLQRLWPHRFMFARSVHELLVSHQAEVVAAWDAWADARARGQARYPKAPQAPEATRAKTALAAGVVAWLQDLSADAPLLRDIFSALAHPDTALLGPALAQEMAHVDAIDFDPNDVNGPLVGALVTPTTEGHSRSTFARLLDLVHAVRHQGLCSMALEDPMPEYAPCALFEVPDAAEFYLKSLAGTAQLTLAIDEDDFFFPDQFAGAKADAPNKSEMEAFTGIDGFTRVTPPIVPAAAINHLTFNVEPKAASRLLFALHDPRVPADSAFGLSRAGVQQVTPRLLTATGMPFDAAFQGTVFAWELGGFAQGMRPLAQAFVRHNKQGKLLDLLAVLRRAWPQLVAEDNNFERRLADLLADPALGAAVVALLQAVERSDGDAQAAPWQPMMMAMRAALDGDTGAQSPVQLLISTLPGASLVPQAAGPDNSPWPGAQPLSDLMTALEAHSGAMQALEQLVDRLTTTARPALLAALVQATQPRTHAMDPGAFVAALAPHFLAPDAASERPSVASQSMALLHSLVSADDARGQGTLGLMLQRLAALPTPVADDGPNTFEREAPMQALLSIFLQLARVQPGSTAPLGSQDLAHSLWAVANFLDDKAHGLVRLFDMIALRHGGDAAGGATP